MQPSDMADIDLFALTLSTPCLLLTQHWLGMQALLLCQATYSRSL